MTSGRWSRRGLAPVAVIATLLLLGCKATGQAYRSVAGPEVGRHRVTIAELALSESDFTESALGGPKDVEVRVLKDGAEIFKAKETGFRGSRPLGVSFEVDYDRNARYEFKIDEVTVISEGRRWSWSSTDPGNWIFDDGRRNFGAGSSITFRDEKVQ